MQHKMSLQSNMENMLSRARRIAKPTVLTTLLSVPLISGCTRSNEKIELVHARPVHYYSNGAVSAVDLIADSLINKTTGERSGKSFLVVYFFGHDGEQDRDQFGQLVWKNSDKKMEITGAWTSDLDMDYKRAHVAPMWPQPFNPIVYQINDPDSTKIKFE